MARLARAPALAVVLVVGASSAASCVPRAVEQAPTPGSRRPAPHAGPVTDASADRHPGPVLWQPETRSPQMVAVVSEGAAALYARCGEPDQALERVANELVERRVSGCAPPTASELDALLRVQGAPQIWPSAWSVGGLGDEQEIVRRLASWVERAPPATRPRCGLARSVGGDGRAVVAAVRVDAQADLEPLPTRARLGQWLGLDAVLNVPADRVQVILLGPRGRPRRVPSSLSAGRASSRFALDQPGGWLVQLVATLPNGPLPVLEARVFVEVEPPADLGEPPAPGQAEVGEDASALGRMLNAARASERLPPLERDAELDRLAEEHARDMAERGELGHEIGHGAPDERVVAAGLGRGAVGENVATAATVARAHASLWSSPSHRENLLGERFRRVGLAVVLDARGACWVTEIFTD